MPCLTGGCQPHQVHGHGQQALANSVCSACAPGPPLLFSLRPSLTFVPQARDPGLRRRPGLSAFLSILTAGGELSDSAKQLASESPLLPSA